MYKEIDKKNLNSTVIIPVFNNLDLLTKNLPEVVKAFEYKPNHILEIIVVDDYSTDNSYEFIKKNYPMIRVVRHTKNRGFSSAVNTGARLAKGAMLVLINSDVVPTKNFLENIYKDFEDKTVFAVSLHEDGETWANAEFKNGYLNQSRGQLSQNTHESFWASGGSAVFRRDYWMKLGGFDEKLLSPFYKEDLDLSYRAAKRGFRILWEPESRVYHKHETTISKLNKHYVDLIRERNELIFHWKNITSRNLFRKHLIGLLRRTVSHPGYLKVVLKALTKIAPVLKARKKEVSGSRVSDESVFAKFAK